MLIRVPVVSSASEQRRNNLSSVQSSPWISTCPSETQSMTSLPVSLAPQPSAILSRAVSGARMRLLFVSTTCPFWIISSRMMWTRSRLNMIWWRGAESKKPKQTHTRDVLLWRQQAAAQMEGYVQFTLLGQRHRPSGQTGNLKWSRDSVWCHDELTTQLKYLSRTSTKLWTSS